MVHHFTAPASWDEWMTYFYTLIVCSLFSLHSVNKHNLVCVVRWCIISIAGERPHKLNLYVSFYWTFKINFYFYQHYSSFSFDVKLLSRATIYNHLIYKGYFGAAAISSLWPQMSSGKQILHNVFCNTNLFHPPR